MRLNAPTLGTIVNWSLLPLVYLVILTAAVGAQAASSNCPGNPNALGVSRTIEIDATGGPRFGTLQYLTSVDLRPMEVVLTFDDGPKPKTTEAILDALDHHCVKATFFEVGKSIAAHPELTQEVLDRGQTVGSHSWSHPSDLDHLNLRKATREIDLGFNVLRKDSGGRAAPFFRYPGLNDSAQLNRYLAERDVAIFSCDVITDDWEGIAPSAIVARTLKRLGRKGKGIILLHDTKRATVSALPVLLDELARRGYRIVHIVPKPTDAEIGFSAPQSAEENSIAHINH